MKKFTLVFTLLFVFLSTFGIASAANKEYIIGKGDALSIKVWGEPELSTEAIVRPDGKISLPNIGEMTAVGITPRTLRHRITAALTDLLFNPIVSVSVNSFPSNTMLVYGPGTTSGVIQLNGKTTLLHVLTNVKPDFTADLENAYIERNGEKIATDFETIYKEGKGELANLEILAGDRLFIPKKENLLVFVEGAVNSPTSIPLASEMTILEAIHNAGGFSKFADPNETVITRQVNGKTERIVVRLEDLIDKGDLSQNIHLQPGDLIVVDTSWF